MRFLFRAVPHIHDRPSFVRAIRSISKTLGNDLRNPKWSSYGALEMDSFAPTAADFQLFISAISPLCDVEFTRDLNVAPEFKPEPELFAEAWGYFNAERYWEAHEVLEGIWRGKSGEEKSLLQGIILVCAAFVHHQKAEDSVALGVLRRCRKQLEFGAEEYDGLQLSILRQKVDSILSSERISEFRV